MYINEEQLKDFLVDSSLVSGKDFDSASNSATVNNEEVGKALVSSCKIGEDDLRRTYAYILGIPFVDLTHTDVELDTLAIIPEPIARRNNIVAFKKSEDELEVAVLDTDNLVAIDFVKKTHLKVLPRLTDITSMKHILCQYQKSLKDEFGDMISSETENFAQQNITDDASESELRKVAEEAPAVRIVDSLLRHAMVQNASDIHIEPQKSDLLVRYRIDGILHDAMHLSEDAIAPITTRIKVLSRLKLGEKRLPQDGRFRIETAGDRVSFRVSILPTYYGEKIVMRLLREDVSGFTLDSLGFHGDGLQHVHDATGKKSGLILVTGPASSGKTTTLYTLLDILNTPDVNISTIEDPIEYQMQRINQTQVRSDEGLTISTGLRSLVRQDPDIIMISEISDKETANLAVNAALTGHLVLSTLHADSAATAIARLIDMGVEPSLLASTLKAVIGQRLIRLLCTEKKSYKLSTKEVRALDELVDLGTVLKSVKREKIVSAKATWKNIEFHRELPTESCESGYKGRRGIQEVLPVTESIKELILSGAPAEKIEKQARKEGMLTIMEDGVFKVTQGVTSIDEVLRVVSE